MLESAHAKTVQPCANGSPFVFNDGTMILTNPEQNSTFVGARYIYKFQ